jgi:AraC-like DNA-binding protein/mannose-6-phosphate isomerase-like protein (cupin superfamily)
MNKPVNVSLQEAQKLRPDAAILDELLRRAHFRSDVYFRNKLCDSWSLDTSGTGRVSFHIVREGSCWLHVPGRAEPQRLEAGDVLVVPRDVTHALSSAKNPPPAGKIVMPNKVSLQDASEGVALLCGYLDIDRASRRMLLSGLPDTLIVRPQSGPLAQQTSDLLQLMFNEAAHHDDGAQAVLDRLADALLLYIIRLCVHQQSTQIGLFAALADAQLGTLVRALCSESERDWSLASMAASVNMSRSAFAARFQELLQQPPIAFLTEWRMRSARNYLQKSRQSTLAIAESCGYSSEAAFSKAFKREEGVGPGEYRRRFQSNKT